MARSDRSRLPGLRRIYPPQRILLDRASLLTYRSDAFPLQGRDPLAVVLPLDTGEVLETVRFCLSTDTPYLPRGAGTGLSGGATPGDEPPLLIELAAMKRLLLLDPENRRALVEPGLVNLELDRAAAPHGLCFAPDPSSQAACTLGGNVAENAGGPHCFKYGMTSDHVLGLTLVTGEGRVLTCRVGDGPDLAGLITGSEGTFGILTQLELRLSPAPVAVETWLASYRSLEAPCRVVAAMIRSGLLPCALEILDRSTIQAVEASPQAAGYPGNAEAVLLAELDGTPESLKADRDRFQSFLEEEDPIELESTTDPERRLRLWKGRKGAFGAMGRLAPHLFVLDGAVPRSKLASVLERTMEIGRKHGVTLSNVFHAGDGNLHPNISFDGRNPEERSRAIRAGAEILRHCVEVGGSISGEHGIGLEKLDHMSFMWSPVDLQVFDDMKRAFDPRGLCNPGKVLPTRGGCGEIRSAWDPGSLPADG